MTPARHTAPQQTLRLSQLLAQAVASGSGNYISIRELIDGIKAQALAILLILFALPNILPALPGTSAITGLPLVLLTLQMTIGQGVWLPKFIANRAVPRAGLQSVLHKSAPYFDKVERLLRPRLLWLTTPVIQRLLGALMLVLSLVIMLPIPLANSLPALAIAVMAIGMTERDGAFIIAGIMIAAGALLLMVTLYWTLITLAIGQITAWVAL